ncbi:MAG: hypothetical protein JXA49_00980 [Actinobacteria bacterium]|nr:hypothetical protein [Actinomycetota bacterium]
MKHPESYGAKMKWEKVAVAPNEVVAGLLETALKRSGIPVLNKKTGLDDFPLSPANQRAIYVPQGMKEVALELLRDLWDIER